MIRNMIHDCIKIKYVREGYLPNIPYHLVSDEEMCSAFMNGQDADFWSYQYPLVTEMLQEPYQALKDAISWHLSDYLNHSHDETYTLPDWVYSYMLGAVISVNAPQHDMHDMLVMLGRDNINDVFTPDASMKCYEVSQVWLKKIPPSQLVHRPPTMFGEPHVLKALRLQQVSVNK